MITAKDEISIWCISSAQKKPVLEKLSCTHTQKKKKKKKKIIPIFPEDLKTIR